MPSLSKRTEAGSKFEHRALAKVNGLGISQSQWPKQEVAFSVVF